MGLRSRPYAGQMWEQEIFLRTQPLEIKAMRKLREQLLLNLFHFAPGGGGVIVITLQMKEPMNDVPR